MNLPKTPKFQAQRSIILNAAAQLFAEHGFHYASMVNLAKASGLSKPLIYHYYKDKEEILFDIVDSYMSQLVDIVQQHQQSCQENNWPHQKSFEILVASFMTQYQHAQHQHMVLVQDVKFLRPDMRSIVVAKEKQVVGAFAQMVQKLYPGLQNSDLITPLTMSLFGMMNWTFTWLKPGGKLSHAQMGPLVSQLFLGGIESIASELAVQESLQQNQNQSRSNSNV